MLEHKGNNVKGMKIDNTKCWCPHIRRQAPATLKSPGAEQATDGEPVYPPDVSHESEHALSAIVPPHPEVTYPALGVIEAGSVHVADGERSTTKNKWRLLWGKWHPRCFASRWTTVNVHHESSCLTRMLYSLHIREELREEPVQQTPNAEHAHCGHTCSNNNLNGRN